MNDKYGDCMGVRGPAPPDGRHEGEVGGRPSDHPGRDRADSPASIPCEDMPSLLVSYRFDELDHDLALRDAVAGHLAHCPRCHVAFLALKSGLRVFGHLVAEVGGGTDPD